MLLYKISKSFNRSTKNNFSNKLIFSKNIKSVYSHINIYSTKYQLTISQVATNLYKYPMLSNPYFYSRIVTLIHFYFLYKKHILNQFIKVVTRFPSTIYTSKNNHVIDKSYNKIILLL